MLVYISAFLRMANFVFGGCNLHFWHISISGQFTKMDLHFFFLPFFFYLFLLFSQFVFCYWCCCCCRYCCCKKLMITHILSSMLEKNSLSTRLTVHTLTEHTEGKMYTGEINFLFFNHIRLPFRLLYVRTKRKKNAHKNIVSKVISVYFTALFLCLCLQWNKWMNEWKGANATPTNQSFLSEFECVLQCSPNTFYTIFMYIKYQKKHSQRMRARAHQQQYSTAFNTI